ncbi:L,D-transpeptidase family protein [Hymenobacter sp. BT770]|uniref:L,D-transpeptidase family protein n=1 Tax=Hymenobacter sp. BT770 TaxID=2886942 RepID=UPI001D10081B|nr:L,D-transpeptidase family protein [Hymenobacter sp. BT770]MCC3155169.1 L,D-transpeptidase family protein [Hymenobacter sp. BT770]MDO3417217.1 L,D-transpeptidase family protein [Hymenobacter sp. BT770]
MLDSAAHAPGGGLLAEVPQLNTFYARRAYQPAWSEGRRPNAMGRAALALMGQAEDYGLLPRRYHTAALQALADSLAQPALPYRHLAQQARFDVLLTDGVLLFARHLRRGQLHADVPSPLEKAGSPFKPAGWVAASLTAPDFKAALLRCQPPHREYRQLQQALVRWRKASVGHDTPARRRRAQQLALTLERWRWQAIPEAQYVLVNLPAYRLEMVRAGRVVHAHRVIIGRTGSPTPTFSSQITSFTLAPEWRVPRSIATQQILPYLQANARAGSEHDFLAENNYTLYDAQGRPVNPATVNWLSVSEKNFPYTIRQNPGCGNLLGNIVFRFANPYGLYLSDATELKDFDRPYRALEKGCMHLERPMRLAALLLGRDSVQAALPTEAECELAPKPRSFYLRHPMPLHVRYATCAVVAGQLRFYPDVYGRDAILRRQLFGSQAPDLL